MKVSNALKYTGLTLLGICAFVTAALLTAPLWLAPLAKDRLIQVVDERSRGLYRLEIDDLDLSLFSGGISAEGVALRPDSAQFHAEGARAGGVVVDGTLERFALTGVSWWTLLTERHLAADSLLLTDPDLLITAFPAPARDSSAASSPEAPAPQRHQGLSLEGVRLRGGTVRYRSGADTASADLSVRDLDFEASQVRIDSFVGGARATRFYESFTLRAGGFGYALPDSLHTLSVAGVAFRAPAGTLRLDGVSVEPRVAGFAFEDLAPALRLSAKLTTDSVRLEGFDLPKFLEGRQFRARRLLIGPTDAEVFLGTSPRAGGSSATAGFGLDLAIDTVEMTGLRLGYHGRDPKLDLSLVDTEVFFTDLVASPDPGERPVDIAGLRLGFREVAFAPDAQNLELRIAEGILDYDARHLSIGKLRYGDPDPDRASATKRGAFALEVDRLDLRGLGIDRLLWKRELRAERAEITDFDILAITNFNVPRAGGTSEREIALELIQGFTPKFGIDLLTVKRAEIRYRRLQADNRTVELTFSPTYATIGHVGSLPDFARDFPRARATIKTTFQDMYPVDVQVNWPNGRGSPYELAAQGGAIDLTRINGFLVPIANMRIKSGRLDTLSFAWTADGRAGNGRMRGRYRDFSLELLDGGPQADDKDLLSWFANLALVKEGDGDERLRKGKISATREEGQSMWTHWWELIRSGFTDLATRL